MPSIFSFKKASASAIRCLGNPDIEIVVWHLKIDLGILLRGDTIYSTVCPCFHIVCGCNLSALPHRAVCFLCCKLINVYASCLASYISRT